MTHVQNLLLLLAGHHKVCLGPPPKPVQVPQDGIPSLQVWVPRQAAVSERAEGALSATAHVTAEVLGPGADPSGTPPVTALPVDSEPLTTALSAAFQPVLYPLSHPSLKPMSLPFRDKDVMWDGVKLCISPGSSIIECY